MNPPDEPERPNSVAMPGHWRFLALRKLKLKQTILGLTLLARPKDWGTSTSAEIRGLQTKMLTALQQEL